MYIIIQKFGNSKEKVKNKKLIKVITYIIISKAYRITKNVN